jgi:3-dehydroquinate dehydratase
MVMQGGDMRAIGFGGQLTCLALFVAISRQTTPYVPEHVKDGFRREKHRRHLQISCTVSESTGQPDGKEGRSKCTA